MRLAGKILLLTLALTLGLSGIVIWVVTANITAHEIERGHAAIEDAIEDYFGRVNDLHKQISRFVRLLMEDPQHRALLEQIEFSDGDSRTFALTQLQEEIFGRIVQTELQFSDGDIRPAFHVLLNQDGEYRLARAGSDTALAERLRSSAIEWPFERVVEDAAPIRRYVWTLDRLFVAFGVPLRMEMNDAPTHAYFLGYEVEHAWVGHLVRSARRETIPVLTRWFVVEGRVMSSSIGSARPDLASALCAELARTGGRQARVDTGRALQFDAGGERFVGKVIEFEPARHVEGSIAVVSSLDEALSGLRRIQRNIAMVAAGVIVVALIACRKLARVIATPIEELVKGTERVARGDFDIRIYWTRRDELGQLATSFNDMAAGLRQRDLIKETFGKFVDPTIVEEFLADPERLHLGGERRLQTVLFSDLAGFTTLAETLSPEDLVGMLNRYLGLSADIVAETRGIVDKFIGDAVVAFWGPPLVANHAESACCAALRIVQETQGIDGSGPAPGRPALRVRVGVATGEVLVGNIGSPNRYNYTVIGDSVNLASRLEGVNKVYHTQLLVTGETARQADHSIISRKIDTVRVKGRSEPVELFEVLGYADSQDAGLEELRAAYAEALARYQGREWRRAREAFESVARTWGGDGPSTVMAERCVAFSRREPGGEWDGVWQLETK